MLIKKNKMKLKLIGDSFKFKFRRTLVYGSTEIGFVACFATHNWGWKRYMYHPNEKGISLGLEMQSCRTVKELLVQLEKALSH